MYHLNYYLGLAKAIAKLSKIKVNWALIDSDHSTSVWWRTRCFGVHISMDEKTSKEETEEIDQLKRAIQVTALVNKFIVIGF